MYHQYYMPDSYESADTYYDYTSPQLTQPDFDQLLQQASTIADAYLPQQQLYHPTSVQPGLLVNHSDDRLKRTEGSSTNTQSNFAPPAESYQASTSTPSSGSRSRYKRSCEDWGLLAPNTTHRLSCDVLPTPQSILDGTYHKALDQLHDQDVVVYLPRRPEWSGKPSVPSILFSVKGKPGPYLRDICRGRVEIDGAYDAVFSHYGFKQTNIRIDWPGVELDAETIPCFMQGEGTPVHRAWVCQAVAGCVTDLMMQGSCGRLRYGPQYINRGTKPWNLRRMDSRKVRLMAINYYKKVWVPVLAVDA